jgi:hypothetical protein
LNNFLFGFQLKNINQYQKSPIDTPKEPTNEEEMEEEEEEEGDDDDEWNDMDDGATVTSEYIFSMDISKIKIGLFVIA